MELSENSFLSSALLNMWTEGMLSFYSAADIKSDISLSLYVCNEILVPFACLKDLTTLDETFK